MRAWICALVVGLSFGCSSSGSKNDGGGGGQAGGVAGQAGGVAGQAGGAGGRGGGAGSGGTSAGGTGGQAGGTGGGSDGGLDACAMLVGLSFQSIDERECGIAPPDTGVPLCRWRINFTTATMFTWQHSDYIESGTYTCSANTITAQAQNRGALTAILDPVLWRFTWDGVTYTCGNCP